MNSFLVGLRSIAAGGLIALLVSPAVAARIGTSPFGGLPLMGTEYKISGFNSRLPRVPASQIVGFDGVAEQVGAYTVNESIQRISNGRGKVETWIDFEFSRNRSRDAFGSSPLAEDTGSRWRVNLADLELSKGAKIPEFYMYFTQHGAPAPFGTRHPDSPLGTKSYIGEHPFLAGVKVLRGPTIPFSPGDLPPGTSNALVTKFGHYFTAVHDVERGLGLASDVDGFHVGYCVVEVPEPATCLTAVIAMTGSAWLLRRRRQGVAHRKHTSVDMKSPFPL